MAARRAENDCHFDKMRYCIEYDSSSVVTNSTQSGFDSEAIRQRCSMSCCMDWIAHLEWHRRPIRLLIWPETVAKSDGQHGGIRWWIVCSETDRLDDITHVDVKQLPCNGNTQNGVSGSY